MPNPETNFGKLMKQLQAIVAWFDHQNEVDVEEGMQKFRQATELIQQCSKRLAQLENEFTKIKAELDSAVPPIDRRANTDE